MGKSGRIAITTTDFWISVIEEFRAAHPSRNWGDATVIAHLAELGYRTWSSGICDGVATASSVPSTTSALIAEAPDDGFPFGDML